MERKEERKWCRIAAEFRWVKPALFILGGAAVGLAYYFLIGCTTGSCPITASPIRSMLYMGLVGWLLSGIFGKECH